MTSPHVVDVTDQTFQETVLEGSRERPVLVDFWAPWCGPCQVLGPMLVKLAEEHAGGFLLAKVNTDENPALAQAFRIQSIPTVVLVSEGKVVDAFQGALPESQLRAFLKPHVKTEEGDLLAQGRARQEAGDGAGARNVLERLLANEPDHAEAHLLLARIAFEAGDEDAVRRHVAGIPDDTPEATQGEQLIEALAFRAACGEGAAAWEARLEADPDDLDARHALGCCHAAAGRYEDALEAFLGVVSRDKDHADGAARRAMLTIFALLGPGSDVARTWRRRLSVVL
jgi:putative thioredoxin